MPSLRDCTVAVLLSLGTVTAAAARQTPAPAAQPASPPAAADPAIGESTLTIFRGGTQIGTMQSNVARAGSTWILSSTGRFGDLILNRFEMKYDGDWQPMDLRIEATQAERRMVITTSFGLTTAVNDITQNGITNGKTDQITARTVVLPNNFYGSYEALAVRLARSALGAEIPIYVAPQGEVKMVVKAVSEETFKTPAGLVALRRFAVIIHNIGANVDAVVAIDDKNRFARLEIPAAALSVVRSDLAGVASRALISRNPTDVDVTIPAAGFNIAATLTPPPGVGRLRHPTVLLVAGSGPIDRDETVAGIPIFSQLAAALSAQGFMVARYDKRGVGQSGGRAERVTLQDYAEDTIAIVKWLSQRDDVDPRRIVVAGHSEGGSVAMLAAAREKKISSIVLIATIGTTGAELILEQQRHALDVMKLPDAERQQKIDLQHKVHAAVISERGWEALPPELRGQADTPWFRSVLQFDPAKIMPKVKQPILIVQGDLDTQVPAHHAEQLAALAGGRKGKPGVKVVHVPGVNHLLVKATTGEVQEYAQLTERQISPDVSGAIVDWLRR